MRPLPRTLTLIAAMFAAAVWGCSTEDNIGEHGSPEESRGEHDREGGEHGRGGDGTGGEEESGTQLGLGDLYDSIRNGARLVLAYDAPSNSFTGTVSNTTEATLEKVRVEVHLSNGKELGPTTPVDLAPGAKHDVKLTATSKDFEGWSAHPEVGSGEHGEEGRGEHR